jgi:hypothetical protein
MFDDKIDTARRRDMADVWSAWNFRIGRASALEVASKPQRRSVAILQC